MTDEIVFYTNPMSRGRIVRWMLEEVGQPYRTEIIDYAKNKDPDYLAINPMGKVPALKHGEVVVTEVAAICTYLADAFPQAKLAPPPGDRLRAPYYRWLFFAAGPVEQAVTNKMMQFEMPPGRERTAGYGTFDTAMDVLETAFAKGPFILGERFSAADVYLGSQIGFFTRFGVIPPRPAFQAYWTRLTERPAYVKATELDDALAPMPPPQT